MSILTNQDSTLWSNQTVRLWSPHLHKNGPVRDYSGTSRGPLRTRGRDFSLYSPCGSGWQVFPPKTVVSLAATDHRRCLSWAEQSRWSGLEQSWAVRGEGPSVHPWATSQPCRLLVVLSHCRAFSKLCAWHLCRITVELLVLNKVSSFAVPQIGGSCWCWISTVNHWLTYVASLWWFSIRTLSSQL